MSRKMGWLDALGRGLFAVSLLLMFTGCFWQVLSWSPDGRWVAFAVKGEKQSGDEKILYRCNTRTGQAKILPLEHRPCWLSKTQVQPGSPVACRYLPTGNALLVQTMDKQKKKDGEGEDERWLLYLLKPGSKKCVQLAQDITSVLDVAPDGKRIYYVTFADEKSGDSNSETRTLWEKPLNGSARMLLRTAGKDEGLHFFGRLSPSGKQFAYATKTDDVNGLALLDLDNLTTRSIVAIKKDEATVWWLEWLDEENILFQSTSKKEKEDDLAASLCRVSLRTGEQRVLNDAKIYAVCPLSLSPDKKTVAVSLLDGKKDTAHLALVDVDSGKVEQLTHSPASVDLHPAFSPDGKRVAYLSQTGSEENTRLAILDLKTKRTMPSWTNAAEKELAAAENLVDAGKKAEALKQFAKFLQLHADSPYADLARYYVVRLSAEIPGSDSTLANDTLSAIQDGNLKEEAQKVVAPMPAEHQP